MKSLRVFNRRAGSAFAAAALVLGTTVPAMVSAATVTERSIALTSSVVGETSDLEVKFNTSANVQSFDVTFCDAPNGACNAPTGLDASSVTATSGGTIGTNTANKIQVALGGASSAVDFVGAGLVNPSSVGTIHARIAAYTAADWTGGALDTGTVALAFTDGFSMNGSVLETLTFCVSGDEETNCDAPDAIDGSLGTNGVLDTTSGSDVDVYSYIATNANSGAVVSLKSDATGCGGLLRDGADKINDPDEGCGILPLTTGTLTINENEGAVFGAKLVLSQPANGGALNLAGDWGANYYMNYVDGDATGVTSPYGDPIYNTNDAPTSWGGGQLSFNAKATELTPAGNYSANFSLIATGKF